jgi:hypothetical protein
LNVPLELRNQSFQFIQLRFDIRERGMGGVANPCPLRNEALQLLLLSTKGINNADRSLRHLSSSRRAAWQELYPTSNGKIGKPRTQIATLYLIAQEITSTGLRRALVELSLMRYVWKIEFRPNDLASPRAVRRTDELLPNLEQ